MCHLLNYRACMHDKLKLNEKDTQRIPKIEEQFFYMSRKWVCVCALGSIKKFQWFSTKSQNFFLLLHTRRRNSLSYNNNFLAIKHIQLLQLHAWEWNKNYYYIIHHVWAGKCVMEESQGVGIFYWWFFGFITDF